MTTDTAAQPSTAAPPDPTRHLWQVPVLLVGIAAFICEWQGLIKIGAKEPQDVFVRNINSLKNAYEKSTPDPTDLKTQLQTVAREIDAFPQKAPLARFHLGSGYVRLAEISAAPEEARGYWILAHQHFNLVTDQQLSDPTDRPKLAFRAAKARAAIGLPPNVSPAELALLIAVLSTPQASEDSGETYRIIAELHLRTVPPNSTQAKLALNQYLQGTGLATPPASLARGRLRLGELCIATNDYEQARKCLEQIGTDAPADVLPAAKAALAQVLMADGNFPAAVKEWEILRGAPGVPPALRLTAAYQLATCKLKLSVKDEEGARKLFEEVVKGDGTETIPASINLAAMHLNTSDPARHKIAGELLVSAVKGLKTPADYDPRFVPLNEVQATFELAVTTLLTDGAHEPAMKVAESYSVISSPGRDREKRADVLGAWGTALQKQKTPTVAPEVWKAKFKAAADEFASLAAFQSGTEGKLVMLRRAASYYRQADHAETAAKRLEEAAKLPNIPEAVVGQLWVELADAKLASGEVKDVFRIFNEIMALQTPVSTATRYRLARQFVDSRHVGLVPLGRALFEQIAKQQNVSDAEKEFHERALTELANALIREGNFADAELRLRTQLNIYPRGVEAGLAKLLLGVCLLQRAAAPNVLAADAAKMRVEAVTTFKLLVAECDASERVNGRLTDREGWLRLQAALRVLQAYQQMKKPQDLLFEAATLRDRHRGTVEELIILSLMYHAFKQLNDTGKALDIRDQMREVFDKLGPMAFSQSVGEYSRDYWLKVWFPPDPK